MDKNQIDFINYRSLFKNNFNKGVQALKQILLDKTQVNKFIKDLAGVSVIFSFDKNDPDPNNIELYDVLTSSGYSNAAALTCLSQYVNITDKGYEKAVVELMKEEPEVRNAAVASYIVMTAIADSEEAWEKLLESEEATDAWTYGPSEAIAKTIVGLVGLNPNNYDDMESITDSYEIVNAISKDKTAWKAAKQSTTAMAKWAEMDQAVITEALVNILNLNADDYKNDYDREFNIDLLLKSNNKLATLYSSELAMRLVTSSYIMMSKIVMYTVNATSWSKLLESGTALKAWNNCTSSAMAKTLVSMSSFDHDQSKYDDISSVVKSPQMMADIFGYKNTTKYQSWYALSNSFSSQLEWWDNASSKNVVKAIILATKARYEDDSNTTNKTFATSLDVNNFNSMEDLFDTDKISDANLKTFIFVNTTNDIFEFFVYSKEAMISICNHISKVFNTAPSSATDERIKMFVNSVLTMKSLFTNSVSSKYLLTNKNAMDQIANSEMCVNLLFDSDNSDYLMNTLLANSNDTVDSEVFIYEVFTDKLVEYEKWLNLIFNGSHNNVKTKFGQSVHIWDSISKSENGLDFIFENQEKIDFLFNYLNSYGYTYIYSSELSMDKLCTSDYSLSKIFLNSGNFVNNLVKDYTYILNMSRYENVIYDMYNIQNTFTPWIASSISVAIKAACKISNQDIDISAISNLSNLYSNEEALNSVFNNKLSRYVMFTSTAISDSILTSYSFMKEIFESDIVYNDFIKYYPSIYAWYNCVDAGACKVISKFIELTSVVSTLSSLLRSNDNLVKIVKSDAAWKAVLTNKALHEYWYGSITDSYIAKAIASVIDLDPANYTSTQTLISESDEIRNSIIESKYAYRILSLYNSATWTNATSDSIVDMITSFSGLDSDEYTDIESIVSSEEAMSFIVESETAMRAISISNTFMEAIANSKVALKAIASSEMAMDIISKSIIAYNKLLNSSLKVRHVPSTSNTYTKYNINGKGILLRVYVYQITQSYYTIDEENFINNRLYTGDQKIMKIYNNKVEINGNYYNLASAGGIFYIPLDDDEEVEE